MANYYQDLVNLIRLNYGEGYIPLHRPVFEGNEKQYLNDCIDSNFVSSVGERVNDFEEQVRTFTGAGHAVATVSGTAALQVALRLAGVQQGDQVITQALTFVATANAISYLGAEPIFVDVDRNTMGMSPQALREFLSANVKKKGNFAQNKKSGARIAACLPMHTFGFPCQIEEILPICEEWHIPVVEDAAESLGSYVGRQHTGTFGKVGVLSFNGNKVITTGGGGMIITGDEQLAIKARHITTTAKVPDPFEYIHDEIGFNYRLPNINAAIGCAQMERLPEILDIKARIASRYRNFFEDQDADFISEREGTKANYWFNTIVLESITARDSLMKYAADYDIMTRPAWRLMSKLPMYKNCQDDGLKNSVWLEQRIVNLPSSVPNGELSDAS